MNNNQYSLIEAFGNGYKKFGHSNLMGRVVGLMLSNNGALTIDEICEALDITKTPITQICGRLVDLEIIRRVWVKGQRKQHFEIADDVFVRASINQSKLYLDNLDIAERHLEKFLIAYKNAVGKEKQSLKLICTRLIIMKEYTLKLLAADKEFIKSWESEKEKLPDVDEYLNGR
ncbi:MAG TPA: hypothetical protein QF484_03730 [Candidatus Marinimicrobia bacterium]|jgi:DNA-binding transcriptional regulator GbsR (MarR family)|nr:hypothetical protein [Candidatus Neomarinimicrobiota bacterium]HJL75090.1 hypothetical protein [Candidatus Neomarinimicrobiota bacterium]HJM12277.1 hypothetical protein [Candidatus Neomarinimicrobiota bacterium]|tara:strand:+ start:309 stop:830 length:522 start_codon:yes stop_codon:yes gene_type:complete